jgi:hypothetical protein
MSREGSYYVTIMEGVAEHGWRYLDEAIRHATQEAAAGTTQGTSLDWITCEISFTSKDRTEDETSSLVPL